MKMYRSIVILICLLSAGIRLNGQTVTIDSNQKRMEWFDQAKLGIFIHWGIYAVDGVSESWSFFNNYLPYDQYMNQMKGFTASKYNPKEWVDLIKQSGARYTVITTKHHDGVALWDTKVGELSAVKGTPAARDLITPFVKEVRKQGLKLGFYYSLLDWSHPDYPNKTRTETRYKDDPERWARFVKFNFDQLTELNKGWKPDLYWFDGDWEQSAEAWKSKEIVDLLRSTNPEVIINSRIQGYGDYATPEQGVPVVRPSERYWELCMTMNDSWGYQHADSNYKTPTMLLRTFVDCLSMGGNLLLDIGPKADGTIPEEQVATLKAFGRWTSKHKEAIYQTRAGIPNEHFQGYTTLNKAGDILYLYLPYRPNGPIEIKGLLNKVNRVWVVGHGTMLPWKIHNKNYWSDVPGNLYIDVPERVQDEEITVLAVLLDGPIKLYSGAGKVIESN
ncbi:alpha-L-fucosidase [Bacteroides sp.]|uniref:alpha-L-fucosidase n=1 Tax=Bacteroides sp. TaxID=29523 RepID=UPI001B58A880|nr:alpha-L-fucosidase [Bacteroides sp.]MBP6065297.1 alpha-L-fucosidase [Bacteroides sp.]MBP6067253.1 alpha-L-fucosidase [Bacteroides sp.]MBP6936817.1 alpha-L-fucosidase [Bacteroides sp.]MBP8621465.1 alpha-L-fucosidase [Bacteroides sp.]MBP9586967.1 alpha-L-fucosidase [Bacteroides sp.]